VGLNQLDDPNFTVDSHNGCCIVGVKDSFSVVILNNPTSIEVEVYGNTEDDHPRDSMVFEKTEIL
jgi:hypothetical protein